MGQNLYITTIYDHSWRNNHPFTSYDLGYHPGTRLLNHHILPLRLALPGGFRGGAANLALGRGISVGLLRGFSARSEVLRKSSWGAHRQWWSYDEFNVLWWFSDDLMICQLWFKCFMKCFLILSWFFVYDDFRMILWWFLSVYDDVMMIYWFQ